MSHPYHHGDETLTCAECHHDREANSLRAELAALRSEHAALTRALRGVDQTSRTWQWVLAFAREMEAKLAANRHKGDRNGWKRMPVQSFLLPRLLHEIGEMTSAIEEGGDVISECADVANFAMMIADVAGGLRIPVRRAVLGGRKEDK